VSGSIQGGTLGWLRRLLGIHRDKNDRAPTLPVQPISSAPSGTKRIRRPSVKGKSPEQRAAELTEHHKQLRESGRASFARDRANASAAGSTAYRWRSCGDGDVCPACSKRDGKLFRWDSEPPDGHPGCVATCPGGYCRCWAEAVLD
jgi:hypothetical protein